MKFVFTHELFWGSLLMLIGLSMIIKTIFGIDIPVLRTAAALFLMYVGFTMITGIGKPFTFNNKRTIRFDQKTFKPRYAEDSYSVAFGKGIIDLTHLEYLKESKKVTIKTHFGETILKISKNIPTKIHAHVTFGTTILPNQETISAGSYTYLNYTGSQEPLLDIETFTTFGNLQIREF